MRARFNEIREFLLMRTQGVSKIWLFIALIFVAYEILANSVTLIDHFKLLELKEKINGMEAQASVCVEGEPALTINRSRQDQKDQEVAGGGAGKSYFGVATWYGEGLGECDGCGPEMITASGEPFDETKYTCASNDWPFGTMLQVNHNGKEIICKVNDRMAQRVDLSKASFQALAPLKAGAINVVVKQ